MSKAQPGAPGPGSSHSEESRVQPQALSSPVPPIPSAPSHPFLRILTTPSSHLWMRELDYKES